MKKKLAPTLLFTFLSSVFLTTVSKAQTISERIFGVNAWMPDTIGDVNNCPFPSCIKFGKLHKNWQKIQDSRTTIVRFGGIAPDKNKPTNYQYIRMVDSIRQHGMEPVLQVPFWDNYYTAQQAAAIVQYVNVTMNRDVKYWIIANEPNLSYNYSSSSQVAVYFRAFASAMKAVDPTIKIIGPETAGFKQSIVTGLTTPGGPDDITGTDPNGNYYLDIYSFHTYPFNGGNHTWSQVPYKLTSSGGYEANLTYLNSRLASANAYHNRTGDAELKSAVTETNIVYSNASNDNLYGVGANSFIGGQFVCEIYGIGMKKGVDMINLWSVIEGNTNSLNIGYLDNANNGAKKPLYYHYQLMAGNFSGQYVNSSSSTPWVKTFACNDSGLTKLMIMNMDSALNYKYTVRLNQSTISTSSPLKINVNAGLAVNYNDSIPAQGTYLLTFDAAGNLIKKCEYTLANHAALNLPPTCISYNFTLGAEGNLNQISNEINVHPNPSNGKFTIKLQRAAQQSDEDFRIEVYNLTGQKVFEKKTDFKEQREEVDLSAEASGIYILSISHPSLSVNRKIMIAH